MIALDGVVKSFPQRYGILAAVRRANRVRRVAIDDVSFDVRAGELFGLLGANGSGKSTLMRMIAGLITPDAGRIVVAGTDVVAHPVAARHKIGLSTGDERSFYGRLSARQNLRLFAGLLGLSRTVCEARISMAVAAVDLQGDIDRRFDSFSSGMRQRLAVARALLGDPDVLLLDEPTRALDPVHAEELRSVIRDQLVRRHGKTVIVATNVLDEAWELCDRVAVLRAGRLIAVDDASVLRNRATGNRRYHLTVDRVDDALLERIGSVSGVVDCTATPGAGEVYLRLTLDPQVHSLTALLRAVSANGIAVIAIRDEAPSASALFNALTEAGSA